IFGHCCGAGGSGALGCGQSCGCGDIGCSTCAGGAPAGGGVYYEGAPSPSVPRPTPHTKIQPSAPAPGETTNVFEDKNWEAQRMQCATNRPTRSAPQQQGQISGRYTQQELQQQQFAQKQAQRQVVHTASRQQVSQQPQRLTAAQVAARRAALQK